MDDSVVISTIPCSTNNAAEDAIRADRERYQKEAEQLINEHVFSDEEDDNESSDESASEYESDSEGHSASEMPKTSMLNYNDNERLERPDQQTSYNEQSVHSGVSSNSQHSCDSNSSHCSHSFQTETQGPSEIPSDIDVNHVNGNHQTNGHSPPFSDHHTDSRFQETSYVDYSNVHGYAVNGSSSPTNNAEMEAEYRSLRILYDSTVEELQRVKNAEQACQKDAEQQKRIFENQIYLLNDEKETLLFRLQHTQSLVSGYESEKKSLLDHIRSLEDQLSDVLEARNMALSKLESSEITVHSLEKQLRELHRSENLSRTRDQHDRILEDLKMRHQKEVLKYKESIDELQAQLNLKSQEVESLTEKKTELHEGIMKLQQEKTKQCNDLYTQIEMAQEKYRQLLLKNGTADELDLLKLQVQRLKEENLNMSKQNEALKDDIKSLKVELSTSDALQTKPKTIHRASDKRQKESELENPLLNVRTLRSENSDLKKQLKDSENELAQRAEKIRLYELQITELEIKAKHLEEKLKYLTSNESISVNFHEKKIKSLEQELQLLKIDYHDMTKKLKEATSNEKFLREHNEDLQKRMGEMMQRHSEEKLKSVEECRLKYLELHENMLSKEREKLGSKAEKELDDVRIMYEHKIAELQKEKKALSEIINKSKSQQLEVFQGNQNLQMKLDQVYKNKDRREIENELRAEYETQLKQMKDQIKQKDEYLDNYLKVEVERAQIDWTNKKMAEIKVFVENTKQRLDKEFQNCMEKERNSLHQELKLEIQKLEEDHKQKLNDLKQQYNQEKHEQSTQLRQDFQSEWLQKLALVKEEHEKETKHLKHDLENKLFVAQMELKSLNEKLAINSKAQEEVEKIKQEYIQKQSLFNQEKAQLLSSDSALNENLKILLETEKRLREKLLKYERHTKAIKKRHAEDMTNLQTQLSDLQKSCEEKQSQILSIRSRYEQQLMELSEKFRRQHNICRSSETQTEEEMVSKKVTANMEAKFFKCLQNISDEFRQYLIQSRKRNAEKLKEALQLYHQQMYSKSLKDISNDIQSFTPTFIVPRPPTQSTSTIKLPKQTFDTLASSRDFNNGQFQTSTPGIFASTAGTRHVQSEMAVNKNRTPDKRNSSPNLNHQTKPKSLPKVNVCQNSGIFSNYFSTIYKNVAVDEMSSGDASKLPNKTSRTNGQSGARELLGGKDNEAVVDGFSDISYDFIPIHLPAGIYDSNKLPNGGLFENGTSRNAESFRNDSFPVKHFPR